MATAKGKKSVNDKISSSIDNPIEKQYTDFRYVL